ncbi:MAG: trans-sulfuration enzyme family protein [Planctomycetota bacterium]|jgi:methionine-gamma-lyase
MSDSNKHGFATRIIELANVSDRSAVPIYMGTTNQGEYTRDFNPTIDVLEKAICALDGGVTAVAAASGMAAITQTLLALVKTGGRIVHHRNMYCTAVEFFESVLADLGVESVAMDLRDLDAVEKELQTPTQMVYGEPLTNPSLQVIDMQAVADLAHKAGATFVVDNTFLTPNFCRPIEHGVDVVVYSATKYLCGHGDALGGVTVCKDSDLGHRIRDMMALHGGVMSPFNASLIIRGIKTLVLRTEAQAASALALAEFLQGHPMVEYVHYPGLPDDSEHALAVRQMSGFGGVIGFGVRADQERTEALKQHLKLAKVWPSLGDVETLVTITRKWGPLDIAGSFVRVSVGLENIDDIIADFDQALKAI